MRPALRFLFGLGMTALASFAPPLAGVVFAQAPAASSKPYQLPDLDSDAIRLEEALRKRAPTALAGRSVEDLVREAATLTDPKRVLPLLAAALQKSPGDSGLWLAYARTSMNAALRDPNQRWTLQNEAKAAALRAYQRASGAVAEAAALTTLGNMFNATQDYRRALNTWRTSLALADNPAIRKAYEELRERQGFRILDYRVESDLAAPRICFQFSETLKARTDFAPYVAVSGAANAAVTTEDRQLCVEGLKHGERYAVVLRQGLPSSVEESLLKSADYEVYVRDRSPQARFTGRNYVLPRVGQEGVPVVTTNTAKVGIDIARIGDRSLLPTIRSDDFLSQVGSWRLRELFDEKGVKVWSGTLDVKSELNKDVVTAFPVLDAVKKLEPGVYVMVALAGDKAPSELLADDGLAEGAATQWFVVSDLGLTTFTGEDGVHVLVRSLASAEPVAGVDLRLIARNNEVLGSAVTDARGHAKFDPGLSRGTGGLAPGALAAATKEGDYSFLDLAQSGFDLTDRGVKGRPAARALDALVYPERGVYRSGETVNVTALLRDPRGDSVGGLPLTMVVKRPDGVEYRRAAVGDQGLGGRAWSFPLQANVRTGTWRVQAFADPKGPAIGEASFLVEDYMPERLDVTLAPQEVFAQPGLPVRVSVDARFLYGAPGAGLEVSGDLSIQPAKELKLPGLENYVAGLEDDEFEAVKEEIAASQTDEKGRALVDIPIPEPTTSKPLEARMILRVSESGGRAVERVATLPVRPAKSYLALRKTFAELREGSQATFNIVALNGEGQRIGAQGLRWTLSRVTNNYQWYNADGRWSFERVKATRRVADGAIDLASDQPAALSAPVGWGAYRLDVTSVDGSLAPVSTTFTVGWSGDATADTPDLLEVNLDRKAYAAGDDLRLRVNARHAAKASVAIIGDRLREIVAADLKQGDNEIVIPAKAEWGASVYAVVLAHRPLDQAARRAPGRALGLAWFSVDSERRKLDVSLRVPDKTEPRRRFAVPVEIAGLQPGEDAFVALAAVDVGILNLTRYATPDPMAHFFGQRQLGAELRDLYGLLIDGMQGSRGAIRSGGDASGAGLEGDRPTQAPMARYSGVVKVGADGKALIDVDLPAFNGTVRLMAVAWTKSRVGSAEKDVIVRDSVVVQATVPRFLNYGDRSQFHLAIENVDGAPGDYTLDVDLAGPVTVPVDALSRNLALPAKGRTQVTIPVSAAGIGRADVSLRLTGPGLDAGQSLAFAVQSGASEIYRRSVRDLAPGGSFSVSGALLGDFLPGTGAVSVAASPLGGIDAAALLQALDRYPYGCTEQTVSRALPLLYVNQLASAHLLPLDGDLKERVQAAVDKVLARQDYAGGFGLWSSESANDLWLDAFVTDFLTRAREAGHDVPQRSLSQALERLRNQAVNANEIGAENAAPVAYALYVLARNGRPVMGDLRYLSDTKMSVFATPLARAQIGAAFALLGDRGRAQQAFASAGALLGPAQHSRFSRPDYGSALRDGAGLLALAAETNAGEAVIQRAASVVAQERDATRFTSTQENAWMVLAATALSKQAQAMSFEIDGEAHQGAYHRAWKGAALDGREVRIVNRGQAPAQIVVTVSGQPVAREPAQSSGYHVERGFYTLDGKPASLAGVKQNDRLVVALKVTELEAAYARLLLVDHLPAGFEIDNPRLVDSADVAGLPWLNSEVKPDHSEYRDDRFVAAVERNGRDKAVFHAAYIVRAVSPGRYVLPPAVVEDMYRPERFGRTAYGEVVVTPK